MLILIQKSYISLFFNVFSSVLYLNPLHSSTIDGFENNFHFLLFKDKISESCSTNLATVRTNESMCTGVCSTSVCFLVCAVLA